MIARSLLTQTDAVDIKIFYSYARRDESWRKEVDRLLPQFEWDVTVRTWYDGEIEPGVEWEPEIDLNLQAADVILLFIGQAFLDSRYCREVELPVALRRHASGEVRVVPIIFEETKPDWRTLDFARLQALPQNGVPVSAWNDRQRAIEAVVQGLVDLLVHQGLHHHSRIRWELHIEGNPSKFTHKDRLTITTDLRRFTGDATLRCVVVGSGSIVLTMESTQDAFARVRRAFDNHEFRAVSRWNVYNVLQLFGASIRASSTISDFQRPVPLPDLERMLLPSRRFVPAVMKGIALNDEEPLHFDSIIDSGHSEAEGDAFGAETHKLLDYFNTCLAIRDDDAYVNLSPHDDVKLLGESLMGTRLGSALLEFDYRLKRLAGSLLHPDLETGQRFWREVLWRSQDRGATDRTPIAAYQRVWIVPEKAVVYEGTRESIEHHKRGETEPLERSGHEQLCAFVIEQHLKAMTERQYLTGRTQSESSDEVSSICDEVFREIVLPVVEKEVNEGENFAELRQFYYSLILATWFKRKYRNHPKVAKYIESGRPTQLGVQIVMVKPWSWGGEPPPTQQSAELAEPPQKAHLSLLAPAPTVERIRASASYQIPENREYFERYLDVFEHGVFYIEREEIIPGTGLKRPRAYLAGAIDLRALPAVLQERTYGHPGRKESLGNLNDVKVLSNEEKRR